METLFLIDPGGEIEAADAEIDAGYFFTGQQVQAPLKQKHAEWIQQRQL